MYYRIGNSAALWIVACTQNGICKVFLDSIGTIWENKNFMFVTILMSAVSR